MFKENAASAFARFADPEWIGAKLQPDSMDGMHYCLTIIGRVIDSLQVLSCLFIPSDSIIHGLRPRNWAKTSSVVNPLPAEIRRSTSASDSSASTFLSHCRTGEFSSGSKRPSRLPDSS